MTILNMASGINAIYDSILPSTATSGILDKPGSSTESLSFDSILSSLKSVSSVQESVQSVPITPALSTNNLAQTPLLVQPFNPKAQALQMPFEMTAVQRPWNISMDGMQANFFDSGAQGLMTMLNTQANGSFPSQIQTIHGNNDSPNAFGQTVSSLIKDVNSGGSMNTSDSGAGSRDQQSNGHTNRQAMLMSIENRLTKNDPEFTAMS